MSEKNHKTSYFYDLIILGGGINGAGIARDAAGRGLKVLLCEQRDLASGTSMYSSKLIHGGLRYLEYAEFRLVREALQEREVLLNIAPHIVWPLTFLLPWQAHLRPKWLIRLGLFLYDHLAAHPGLPNSKNIQFKKLENNPLKPSFISGFSYSDCHVEDSRLVTLNARDAYIHGATVLTYTQCIQAQRFQDEWQVSLKSQDGTTHIVRSKVLINACGPWVDSVNNQILQVKTKHRLNQIQGSHIVIPKAFDLKEAFILQLPDKRIIFVLPFQNNFHLIGTTDIEFSGDAVQAKITAAEIDYLIQHYNSYFNKQISKNDIVWSFCGVRGLVDDGSNNPSAISRDYVLELNTDQAPALSIFGGKITTYRKLAEHVMQLLTPILKPLKPAWTATAPLPGGEDIQHFNTFEKACLKRYDFLDAPLVKRLCRFYGNRIHTILKDVSSQLDLGTPFVADLYPAEVKYLIHHEFAKTAEDILWRRTKTGLYADSETIAMLNEFINRTMLS